MGFLGWLRTARSAATFEAAQGPRYAVDLSALTPEFFGFLETDPDPVAPVSRLSRAEAIQCPAVLRARNLIAGTIGSLPMLQLDGDFRATRSALLDQPERDIPRSVTMTRTLEDLLFEGIAWWRVVERDYRGYPTHVRRLEPTSVEVREDLRAYVRRDGSQQGQAWEQVPDGDLIRFYSPNDALLAAGARAIRTALRLDSAASRYAETPTPTGYFEPREGADPIEDDDVAELLDNWQTARRARSTAYIPAALKYNPVQYSPADLQLADARQHAVLEIARCVGIDPEDLGVSTTSRTYQNGQQRRLDRLNDTLNTYITAVQDRLSMGDITPRGYVVRADLNGFLRADDKTRYEAYALGRDLGLYGADQIQRREELPPFTPPSDAPAATVRALRAIPATQEDQMPGPMAATADMPTRFDAGPLIVGFEATPGATFEVDVEARTIYGLAAPYGVASTSNRGRRFQFSNGSIRLPADIGRVKLLVGHDRAQAIGRAVELESTASGLWARFRVARGDAGDRALAMAADGVWDGLSIGLRDDAQFEARDGLMHLRSAELAEISLTPDPAFPDARVTTVAASLDAPNPEGTAMPCTTCGQVHAPGTPCAAPAAPTTTAVATPGPGFDMDALADALAQRMRPQGPEVISAAGGGLIVNEEAPYRFDRGGNLVAGRFDFSTDLIAGLRDNDRVAYDRALQFVQTQFDVDTTDGAALTPTPTRPDLYVDQRQYRYPLWEATRAGTLTDNTPFVIPKFNTATGLVAAHTEATEPAPGAFTATSATVTPGAVSGKVEITRELWDRGGNPQVSGLIWRKMEQAYYEGVEAKVVAVLDAASPTGITLTTAGADSALSGEIAGNWAALQYVRGGFAFDTFAVQVDLYKALAQATDDAGAPLFPIYGPTNRDGQSAPRYGTMNVHGVDAFPEWALAATGTAAASSYLFDRQSVRTWASSPQRLEWNFGATVQTTNIPQVSYVTLGIWGYSVSAITDLAGVREVIYDPAA